MQGSMNTAGRNAGRRGRLQSIAPSLTGPLRRTARTVFASELHALRVDLFLHQQGLDTTTPAGKAMFQMLGVFAEFERSIIQERVRPGFSGP
jgi:DNA invertase Pin-like site-specific DNA recombinase